MNTNTAIRTFDCPWCGAISVVPADHLGEHFNCPECRKPTKITEKNTTAGDPTQAPADAPHLSGDRTFDCPWCGAISAVPSSHLGERFVCPECHKDTKLTSTNTQRASVTVPPPDAPHVEPSYRGFWIGLAVVVLAGIGWFALRGSEGEPAREPDRTAQAPRPALPPSPAGGMAETAPPAPAPGRTEAPPPAPAPGMTGAAPPEPPPAMAEAPPPPPAESPELVRARAQRDAAAAAFASASEKLARAAGAVDAWKRVHPGAEEAARELPVLEETSAELARLLADASVVADPASPRPAEVRSVRAAMARFVEASPARVALAERALGEMRKDLGGREVAGVADWRDLPYAGEGFRRTAARFLASARAAAIPAELVAAQVSAAKEAEAARAALDSATAGLKALEGGTR